MIVFFLVFDAVYLSYVSPDGAELCWQQSFGI